MAIAELDQNQLIMVGTDGRANALTWKLLKDNPNLKIKVLGADTDFNKVAQEAADLRAGLTIVSPEGPLVKGIVDTFNESGLPIVGPDMEAAKLEGDKIFAVRFMENHGIPNPKSIVTTGKDESLDFVKKFYQDPENPLFTSGLVIKYPLLAAGKGVTLPETLDEAIREIEEIYGDGEKGKFGTVPKEMLFQGKIIGQELSMMFLSDGQAVLPLLPARDYKKAYDGDSGPNTGGMGSFAPVDLPRDIFDQGVDIANKTVSGMTGEGHPFKGILYIGLILTQGKLLVLEYNVRFGDPEIQSLLVLMRKNQLLDNLKATTNKGLAKNEMWFDKGYGVTVVVAAGNYPQGSSHDKPITLPELPDDVVIFQAGVKKTDGHLFTNGGRIVGVTAKASTLKDARVSATKFAGRVVFEDSRFRMDIAAA